jgi:hypothetical protein
MGDIGPAVVKTGVYGVDDSIVRSGIIGTDNRDSHRFMS